MKKDLKGKERVVPPGIEIPGIPTQKMVNDSSIWTYFTQTTILELVT